MDLVARCPRLPVAGETVLGSAFATYPGGKGANQAVAAGRLGGKVRMVGLLGDDDFAGPLRQSLRQAGVDDSQVLTVPQCSTGVALIAVSDDGANQIVVVPGANASVVPQEVPAVQGLLLAVLEIPLATVVAAFASARAAGALTVLNPAPAVPLPEDLLKAADYLVPNETELEVLVGVKMHSSAEVRRGASLLRSRGAHTVVVTRGAAGAFVLSDAGELNIPAFKVEVVDTTAAGDAFCGALAVALAEGQALEPALYFASAAAAISVTRQGAQPSLPQRAEVEQFLAAHKPAA
ncbi:MAG: ribokinase [Deinococcus sp.]|nr:ribokinase [Deinococcus sp.]